MEQEDYYVSKHTLNGLEKMVYNINVELLNKFIKNSFQI